MSIRLFPRVAIGGEPKNVQRLSVMRFIVGAVWTTCCAAGALTSEAAAAAPIQLSATTKYTVQELVKGSPLRGVQGLAFGPDGKLYAGSLAAQTIYRVDIKTGALEVVVPPPLGAADDLAIARDGTMAWTDIGASAVRVRHPDGRIVEAAKNLPAVNGIGFDSKNRLFVTQVLEPSTLLEIDIKGGAPREVMKIVGGLNGFEIDAKDQLYGPLAAKGEVVRIDLASAKSTTIAKDLTRPMAVNLDAGGNAIVVDYDTGDVTRLDAKTGGKKVVAKVRPPIDNLAIAASGLIYLSRPGEGAIDELNPKTGKVRTVVGGWFTGPGGLTIMSDKGRDNLIVADLFGYRFVDPANGAVRLTKYVPRVSDATSVTATDTQIIAANAWTGVIEVYDRDTGAPRFKREGYRTPFDLAPLPGGDVLLVEYGTGRVLRLGPLEKQPFSVIAEGLDGPVGVATDGKVAYISEARGGGIRRVDLGTGQSTRIADSLSQPQGLALRSNGHLLVVETGRKQLIEIDPVTCMQTIVTGKLDIGGAMTRIPGQAALLNDVAIGRDGAIYVTTDLRNSVLKITAAK